MASPPDPVPPVPTAIFWSPASPKGWIVETTPEVVAGTIPDLSDWLVRVGIIFTNPTTILLDAGRLVLQQATYGPLNDRMIYSGPPPSFLSSTAGVLQAFDETLPLP